MSCNALTKGRGLDCSRSLGGVRNIYFGVYDVTTLTIASSEVTDIQMGANDLYKYSLEPGVASVTETVVGDSAAGTIYYTPSVTILLNKLTKEDQNELKALAQSKLIVYAELNQITSSTNTRRKILCLGALNGMRLNAGTDATGAAWGDRNGYEWTLDGIEQNPMAMVATYSAEPFDNGGFIFGDIITG